MKKPKTDKERILEYLKEYKVIDAVRAFQDLHILGGFRARISELRKEGHNIQSKVVTNPVTGRIHNLYELESEQQLKLFQ